MHISSAIVVPHEARQPLCAASAGDDAEQNLGLPDPRVSCRDAVVTGHRHFVAAAERIAVDGRDERLAAVLEPLQQRVRAAGTLERLLAGLQCLEDLDVGAGDERGAGADEHDRVDAGIRRRPGDRVVDRRPDGRARAH